MASMPIDPNNANDFAKPANILAIGSIVLGAIMVPIRYFAPASRVKHLEKKVDDHVALDEKRFDAFTNEFKNALESTIAQLRVDLREHRHEVAREVGIQFDKIDNFVNLFQTIKAMKEAEKKHPEG